MSRGKGSYPSLKDDRSQAEGIILRLIVASWAAYLVVIFFNVLSEDYRVVAIMAGSALAQAIPFALLKRHRVKAAGWILMASVLCTLALLATFGQGSRDLAILAFPILLVFTSVAMDRAAVILYAALILAVIVWLVLGEMYRWYVPLPIPKTSWADLCLMATVFITLTYAVVLIASNMRGNLDKAREEISQRIRVEGELRASEARLRSFINEAGDAIYVFDPDSGRILDTNRQACLDLGYSMGEILELKIADIEAPRVPGTIQSVSRALSTGASALFGSSHRRKDGSSFPVEVRLSLIAPDQGRRCMAIARNVTDRRHVEEALQNAQRLESLGSLAGGIAHDFNNLMGGIFGYINLASEKSTDERVAGYLEKAMAVMDKARGLTSQLLTFAKGGAPEIRIDEIFPVIAEAATSRLSGSRAEADLDAPGDLWPCGFDRGQISHVVDAIVLNAKEAMPEGGTITIRARNVAVAEGARPPLKPGDYVEISFRDQGGGIPRDVLHRIFDPFFSTKASGHGLGLSSCYSIIHRHGGYIEAESEPGKGSLFRVYLPAVRRPPADPGAPGA
jgi:PAS domain S-box-containing protein